MVSDRRKKKSLTEQTEDARKLFVAAARKRLREENPASGPAPAPVDWPPASVLFRECLALYWDLHTVIVKARQISDEWGGDRSILDDTADKLSDQVWELCLHVIDRDVEAAAAEEVRP